MSEFFRVIGWKKSNGRWDRHEILIDLIVVVFFLCAIFSAYILTKVYNV